MKRAVLQTKAGSPASSILQGGKELAADRKAALLVDDEGHEGDGAEVVIISTDGSVRAQTGTVVGG